MSLNSVNIMGNLTRDPEMKYTNSGRAVCNISLANNRVYSKDGEKVTEVSYFDVEVWGNTAENCSKYLSKGSGLIVDGRLKQDRWEQDGKTRSRVRIVANNVHFMPRKGDAPAGGGNTQAQKSQPSPVQQAQAAHPAMSTADQIKNVDDSAWDE